MSTVAYDSVGTLKNRWRLPSLRMILYPQGSPDCRGFRGIQVFRGILVFRGIQELQELQGRLGSRALRGTRDLPMATASTTTMACPTMVCPTTACPTMVGPNPTVPATARRTSQTEHSIRRACSIRPEHSIGRACSIRRCRTP